MKEPHRKGAANRSNPESCAGAGNIAGEALTGNMLVAMMAEMTNGCAGGGICELLEFVKVVFSGKSATRTANIRQIGLTHGSTVHLLQKAAAVPRNLDFLARKLLRAV